MTAERSEIRRRRGLGGGPGDQHLQRVRPVLFRAVSRCLDDPDQKVREAALAACVLFLDHPCLRDRRVEVAPLIRDLVVTGVEWRHRAWVIRVSEAWGEDTTGLDDGQEGGTGGEQCEPSPWDLIPQPSITSGDASDPPF
ncbi:hypothetical protein [Kutzneria buriramensis]|uniref:hypothetical protein n=1 Tax=Kutzneria buriramensis TaxID=1045776 RepID=UPI0011C19F1A|nr:hypothetical protein [Kutzneria buriramensis]